MTTATTTFSSHPAFEHLKTEAIASLNISVSEYQHRATGAKHIHISSEDTENVFLVAFLTMPEDSTGVAHILEHTALCGSKQYPVRDPFFMMTRRSLNTFMNAFTSSDWTAYPFASKNKKDFGNLLSVYLDAAFFARLDPLDFAQEGHRIEFQDPDDSRTPLEYKGVVYNEMKGAMSSITSQLYDALGRYLFPTTTYHNNSGGDPEHITDLSYEQLLAFYRTHYHPSNAIFMTYGDISAESHQTVFENQALKTFEALGHTLQVPDEKRYYSPLKVQHSYPMDEADANTDKKTHLVMAWLLGNSTDLLGRLKAHLLSDVLLSTSASPLRKALETTKLGTAPSALCGLDDSNREMAFMCGIEGSEIEHADAFEEMVMSILKDIAENGVDRSLIDAALHQLELGQREIGGDGYPYGLQLILSGLSAAVHGGDAIDVINLDPALETLHEAIQAPDFIQSLTKELLLDNQHRVRLCMAPDTQLSAAREAAVSAKLDRIKNTMTDDEVQNTIDLAKALKERQEQIDDDSVLPKVGLDDVSKDFEEPQQRSTTVGTTSLAHYQQGTNGLVYQQLVIDTPDFGPEHQALLPLYNTCVTELGAGDKDYLDMQHWQNAVTGGVNAMSSVRGGTSDPQHYEAFMGLSGKCLAQNVDPFNELLLSVFEDARFDEVDRIRDLVAQRRVRAEQSITGRGHSLAVAAANSAMSPVAAMSYQQSGLAGIQHLKQLDESLQDTQALNDLAETFKQIHQKLKQAPRRYLLINDEEHEAKALASLQTHWSKLGSPTSDAGRLQLQATREQRRLQWITNTQVNFCAKTYPTVSMEHEDAAALTVLGGFLRNGFLHRAIREQGGAYGGGASQDNNIAAFGFYSYRDPRNQDTLGDFDASIDWLMSHSHQDDQLEQAILGVISDIDKPASPAGEAKSAFYNALHGRTHELRKAYRERVLDVSLGDLRRVTERYLQPENANIAIITPSTEEALSDTLGLELLRM